MGSRCGKRERPRSRLDSGRSLTRSAMLDERACDKRTIFTAAPEHRSWGFRLFPGGPETVRLVGTVWLLP